MEGRFHFWIVTIKLLQSLSARLQAVLHSIISDDKTGYLKGWYIDQNIRLLEDVFFIYKQITFLDILLSVDFEKVFDSLNWNFLHKTLENVNFGKNFINYVKTMYNGIKSTVLNNGNTGKYF